VYDAVSLHKVNAMLTRKRKHEDGEKTKELRIAAAKVNTNATPVSRPTMKAFEALIENEKKTAKSATFFSRHYQAIYDSVTRLHPDVVLLIAEMLFVDKMAPWDTRMLSLRRYGTIYTHSHVGGWRIEIEYDKCDDIMLAFIDGRRIDFFESLGDVRTYTSCAFCVSHPVPEICRPKGMQAWNENKRDVLLANTRFACPLCNSPARQGPLVGFIEQKNQIGQYRVYEWFKLEHEAYAISTAPMQQ
jgi:hypothetical protein